MLLLLAACRFPGTVRPTVKIGLVAPFEGRYRYIGYDVIYGVRLALREANAAGGVGGYNVELVAYDDGADPVVAAEQARKLSVDPDVVAAIGHFREETTAAALEVYAEAGIPLVAPAVLDPMLAREEGGAHLPGPTASDVASALLDRLRELGQAQAALVTQGGALGVALQRDAQVYRFVVEPVVSPGDAEWLEEVLASGVEVLFCDADPVAAGEVTSALRAAGWEGVFLGGPELAASSFVAVAGEAAEGALFVTPYPFPADVPGSAGFVAAYRELAPHVPPPGPLALPAYEAARLLLAALERDVSAHGAATREGMASALEVVEQGRAPLYWYCIGADGVPEMEGERP